MAPTVDCAFAAATSKTANAAWASNFRNFMTSPSGQTHVHERSGNSRRPRLNPGMGRMVGAWGVQSITIYHAKRYKCWKGQLAMGTGEKYAFRCQSIAIFSLDNPKRHSVFMVTPVK